jgi:hypothetical protein
MIGLSGFHSNGNRAAYARWMFQNGFFDRVEALNHAAFPASERTSHSSLVPLLPAHLTLVWAAAVSHGVDKLETLIAMTYRLDSCCGATLIDSCGVATAYSSDAVQQSPRIKHHTSPRQN